MAQIENKYDRLKPKLVINHTKCKWSNHYPLKKTDNLDKKMKRLVGYIIKGGKIHF